VKSTNDKSCFTNMIEDIFSSRWKKASGSQFDVFQRGSHHFGFPGPRVGAKHRRWIEPGWGFCPAGGFEQLGDFGSSQVQALPKGAGVAAGGAGFRFPSSS
jgi:hypothetical protein